MNISVYHIKIFGGKAKIRYSKFPKNLSGSSGFKLYGSLVKPS
jgi:hypothetical protein